MTDVPQSLPRPLWCWRRGSIATILLLLVGGTEYWGLAQRGPQRSTEVYRGITYGCFKIRKSPEASGLVHLVRVDLSAPGIQIFLTPLDPRAAPCQYRLQSVSRIAAREHLAVAINGTLFGPSGLFARTGTPANSEETIVADHRVSHVDPNSYLLWFEDDLTPHLELTKPPSPEVLAKACWGISGQGVMLHDGHEHFGATGGLDRRTALGFDPVHKTLYLAVFQRASYSAVARFLSAEGAKEAIALDGGSSTTMVIGADARGTRPGTLLGGLRPVATCFGIRAELLKSKSGSAALHP